MNALKVLGALLCAATLSCCNLTIDQQSTDAFAAGDFSLASSCISTPGAKIGMASGVDSCHFTVGDPVASSAWVLVIPPPNHALNVIAGSVDVYVPKYSIHKTYSVGTGWNLTIPFVDLFGTSWISDQDESVVEALATLTYTDNQGINQILKTRSIAFIIVTAAGYDRMAIDSGNQAWGANCAVQYSSSGRSAVSCK